VKASSTLLLEEAASGDPRTCTKRLMCSSGLGVARGPATQLRRLLHDVGASLC
jgi:hypothetical protein